MSIEYLKMNLQRPTTQDPTNAILCPNRSVKNFKTTETMNPDTNMIIGITAIMVSPNPETVY